MRIIAIAHDLMDLASSCFGTFARLARENNRIEILMVDEKHAWPDGVINGILAAAKWVGIEKVNFVYGFDFSGVTQANADSIRVHVAAFSPDIVFMPSWKSGNSKNQILANTALVSCRGIGSIMMYERDPVEHSAKYVLYNHSIEDGLAKSNAILLCRAALSDAPKIVVGDPSYPSSELYNDKTDGSGQFQFPQPPEEYFECHRMILVNDPIHD